MLFISESVAAQTHLLCARKPNVIGQNENSIVSLLSSVLECFLVKNGFSLPKEPIVRSSGASTPSRKRKKLERCDKFDDSGYAEPISVGETSTCPLEDGHHMPVPDLSTTFYTSPVSLHLQVITQIYNFDHSIGCAF